MVKYATGVRLHSPIWLSNLILRPEKGVGERMVRSVLWAGDTEPGNGALTKQRDEETECGLCAIKNEQDAKGNIIDYILVWSYFYKLRPLDPCGTGLPSLGPSGQSLFLNILPSPCLICDEMKFFFFSLSNGWRTRNTSRPGSQHTRWWSSVVHIRKNGGQLWLEEERYS